MSNHTQHWYRDGPDLPWRRIIRGHNDAQYTSPKLILEFAEQMMAGKGRDNCLWRKLDERARKLIWC